MKIKEMVVVALLDNYAPEGASMQQIQDCIKSVHGRDVSGATLRCQLSRLNKDGMLDVADGLWSLTPRGKALCPKSYTPSPVGDGDTIYQMLARRESELKSQVEAMQSRIAACETELKAIDRMKSERSAERVKRGAREY